MSDSYSVIYSAKAKEDLKDIYSYIAFSLLAPGIAEKQVNRIRKTIYSLNFMPLRNPIVDWEPWKSMRLHRAAADNYIIFYIVDEDRLTVEIIRIVYGGRDISNVIDEKSE